MCAPSRTIRCVGQTTSELVSTKPLFVQLQTPRFFIAGDKATLGAIIHNNGDEQLKVQVSLEAEGVELKSPAEQSIEVPAKQQAYVTWDVTVKDVKRVDLTAHATSGSFEDASKPALGTLPGQGIPVYNFTVPETVGTAGLLQDGRFGHRGLPTADHARLHRCQSIGRGLAFAGRFDERRPDLPGRFPLPVPGADRLALPAQRGGGARAQGMQV